ncbi:MAG: TRAP transporter TatT component family protein [Nitrospinaceae bacterium]|nr:TRAP transporter TatT component family protein [Nitrospinaceae bacterium]
MATFLTTTFLALGVFLGVPADREMEIIKEIDRIYHVAKSSSDIKKLKTLVEESIQVFPESADLLWRQGRNYYQLADKSESETEKIRYFSLCLEQTSKTITRNSKLANGYFFNGLCNGKLGEAQGLWSSLGKIEPLKNDMEIAIKLDPSVNEGGPHRALGNLYLQLPYLLGGNLERSIAHFQEAVRLGPQFGENYLGLAEAYIQDENYRLARDTLKNLLEIHSSTQDETSVREWHAEAHSLLKQISQQSDSESHAQRIKD